MIKKNFLPALITTITLVPACPQAATIWTDWSAATIGTAGSAVGTLNSITASYSGEVLSNTRQFLQITPLPSRQLAIKEA